MTYDQVKRAPNKVVGSRAVERALKKRLAHTVVIAEDADQHLLAELIQLAEASGIPVESVDSMHKLGRAAGIDVPTSAVALLKG
ncbi:MAG: Firmicutes ribosomal L7Ae family protein [Candidatus Carbobacillus altaicus]|uniref:Firmicutes ribosomal L7Ae family protein n=1 Tax=Candidatus Carbonibacillus altaicus TaxID=2163959 RepID=A0A2R6Y2Y6_9BACL|nr:MAG: Firmicutes ribosomal L7Ae family protein [Candidatus Carbobacillus altaicus]